MALEWKSAYASMVLAGDTEFPPAALHYVLEICRNLFRENSGETDPAELISRFRQQVARDFGSMTEVVLTDWNLKIPEDLGRALTLLGQYQCLILSPSDSTSVFSNDTLSFLS